MNNPNHTGTMLTRSRAVLAGVIAIALVTSSSRGQSCRASLDFVIEKTEANYSGFHDKVGASTQAEYTARTADARLGADRASGDSACFTVLNKWLRGFHDGHIAVRFAHGTHNAGADTAVRPTLERLSARTLILTLPNFHEDQAPLVADLLKARAADVEKTENLIIDVRMNGGGADFVWLPVLQLLYTRPVVMINSSIWSTPDNMSKYVSLIADPGIPDSEKPELRALLANLQDHVRQFVRRQDDTITSQAVLPFPRRVAVLTAAGCQSSCEGFVLAARQNTKTCIVGEHTGGVLDYANQWHLAVPNSSFVFWYPTSRSQRLPGDPVDVHGIAVDVSLSASDKAAATGVQDIIERGAAWPCHR
jgi:hypothetical protein